MARRHYGWCAISVSAQPDSATRMETLVTFMDHDRGENSAQAVTLYNRVAARIREDIVGQGLAAHDKIPAEVTLAERLGVSRGTVIKALDTLVREGIIYRRRPHGTFVAPPAGPAAHAPAAASAGADAPSNARGGLPVVGLIVPYLPESFVGSIVLGAETVMRAAGYGLIFAHSENDQALERYHIDQMRRADAAGILILPGNHPVRREGGRLVSATAGGGARAEKLLALQRDGVPFVLIDRYVPEVDCDDVVSDDRTAGYAATQHLIGLGRRRISFISIAPRVTSTAERYEGYLQCLRDHGLPVDEALALHRLRQTNPSSMPAGIPLPGVGDADRALLRDYLRRSARPDAVVTSNDYVALRVLQAAEDVALRIPEDVALACCGGGDIGAHARVPLTSILQPAVDLGRHAAHVLLDRVAGRSSIVQHVVLPVSLVVGRRGGAPPRETPVALPWGARREGLGALSAEA